MKCENYVINYFAHLFKKGDQFPCIVGLSVCQYFFSFAVLTPDDILSLDTWSFTSLTLMLGTATTRLLPFTKYEKGRG